MMKNLPVKHPCPDRNWFKDVILGKTIPDRPPFIELFLDQEVLEVIVTEYLGRQWVPFQKGDRQAMAKYWDNYIEAYYRLGYDSIWMPGGPDFTGKERRAEDTAVLAKSSRRWDEEGASAIASWADFETYPWPSTEVFDLWNFEYVATHLYEGMGIAVTPGRGFLEVPLEIIMGYTNFSLLLYDEPDLVRAVCDKVGEAEMAYYRQVSGHDKIISFFPGDDMGFKSATLIAPDVLRELIFPWHKKAAELAHKHDYLYMLHSCGNLETIMPDFIDDIKIDAKHSFEDQIMPVTQFKDKYGDRIGVLGGIDVDFLCRADEKSLREYTRRVLDHCMKGGRYALGTGNSVANYIPIENYLIMMEEGYNWKSR